MLQMTLPRRTGRWSLVLTRPEAFVPALGECSSFCSPAIIVIIINKVGAAELKKNLYQLTGSLQ